MGRLLFVCLLSVPAFAQTPSDSEPGKLDPLKQSITVNANIAAEAPASIVEIGRPQLEQIPGENLDDRMRYVPGFSMFRRSSSLAANPTTQGISLRGLGSSGASRTLLLWDGIPVNSPFGGWIYWTRLAPEDVERIEMSRGASTSVFGDRAMGCWSRHITRARTTTRGFPPSAPAAASKRYPSCSTRRRTRPASPGCGGTRRPPGPRSLAGTWHAPPVRARII